MDNFGVDKKNQLNVTFCILYFSSNSCSTCFGQSCAHHQELKTAWCYRIQKVTSSWFFLSTLNYDARSTTHQMDNFVFILVFLSRSSLYMSTYSVPNEDNVFSRAMNFQVHATVTKALIHKVCSAVPNGSASSSQGTRGYLSVTATLKFTYSLIKGIMFFEVIAALL